MTDSNDTFAFFDSDPRVRARDLLQECRPEDSKLKTRSIARKALEISEQCLEAWLLLAESYAQFPQASAHAQQAIAIGNTLYPAPFYDDSTEEAPELTPDQLSYLKLHKLLGTLHFQQNQLKEAATFYLKGLAIAPLDPCQIRAQLCLSYIHANKFAEATAVAHHPVFEKSLSSRVAQAYLHFLKELPDWSPERMQGIDELLGAHTLWQWMHERSNSMKRHFRAINHANPFFAAFMLNPSCGKITLPCEIIPRHASEALEVAQAYQSLWAYEKLPLRLLEEYPWENPRKKEIIAEDKPLLLQTIQLLEKHREELRNAAERANLNDRTLF